MEDKRNSLIQDSDVQAASRQLQFDCKTSWFACVCASLASIITVGTCLAYGILFPKILVEFQAGKATTALPGSLSIAVYTILCPVASLFFNRFGGRAVFSCGGLLSSLGLLGSSFAPNLSVLCFTYGVLVGCGTSLIYMAGFQMVPLYFDKHRSVATGIVSSGPAAGLLLICPITQATIERFGWRNTTLILSAINLVNCILGCAITRRVHRASKELKKRTRCVLSMNLSALKDHLLILVIITFVILNFGHYMPYVHLIKFAEDLGISSKNSSWMYSIIGIISTMSRILTGKIGDIGRVSFYHINQIGALLMAINVFLVTLASKVSHLYAYAVMQGICEGMYLTSSYCLTMSASPQQGIGWLMLFTSIPIFISPPLAGFIADQSGSYIPVFYTSGCFFIMAFLCSYLRHYLRKPTEPLRSELVCMANSKTLLVVERETVV